MLLTSDLASSFRFDDDLDPAADGPSTVHLPVETERLQPRGGLLGPTVSVVWYTAGDVPERWQARVLGEARLAGPRTTVTVDAIHAMPNHEPLALGVRLRINTEAPPGLYADFVLVALRIDSATHYASLGFQGLT